jgi:hypothetical protein
VLKYTKPVVPLQEPGVDHRAVLAAVQAGMNILRVWWVDRWLLRCSEHVLIKYDKCQSLDVRDQMRGLDGWDMPSARASK